MNEKKIIRLIRSLRGSVRYLGFHPLIDCLCRLTEDITAAGYLSKRIYTPVAEKYGISEQTLLRRLRSLISEMYRSAPRELWEELMLPDDGEPSVGQFPAAAAMWLVFPD